MGKPSTYTDALATEVCEWLANGGTLAAYCRQEGKPAHRTVHEWRKAHKDFGDAYDEAMLQGCHALLDETLEIADDGTSDFVPGKSGPVFDSEHVQRSKLRVWARHELVKRKRPDVFSDRVQMQHSGSIQSLSDEEVEARYAALMAKAGTGDAGGDPDGD